MFSLQTIFGKGDKFYGLLEASAEAEEKWVDAVVAKASSTLEFAQNCTPGYSPCLAPASDYDEFVNWDKRLANEGPFFRELFKLNKVLQSRQDDDL